MKKGKTFLQSVVVGLCLVLAGGDLFAQTRIEAQGAATIHNNMVDVARDKAIDNAQREAVEKAVGVMVSSFTEVENYQVKMDQILSESHGFISTYKVLDEKREGNQYRVTIEADVSVNRLKDKLEAVNLILSRKSRPRLMVLIGQGEKRDAVAESAISLQCLTTRGRTSKGMVVVIAGFLMFAVVPDVAMAQACGKFQVVAGTDDNAYPVNTETGAVWVLTQRTLASGTGREPVAIPYKFLYLLPEHNAVLDEGGQKIPVKERKTR